MKKLKTIEVYTKQNKYISINLVNNTDRIADDILNQANGKPYEGIRPVFGTYNLHLENYGIYIHMEYYYSIEMQDPRAYIYIVIRYEDENIKSAINFISDTNEKINAADIYCIGKMTERKEYPYGYDIEEFDDASISLKVDKAGNMSDIEIYYDITK